VVIPVHFFTLVQPETPSTRLNSITNPVLDNHTREDFILSSSLLVNIKP
jgi:hypothetical protein